MRSVIVLLVLWSLALPTAAADMLKVSTARFPQAEAVAQVLKEAYGRIGHNFELVYRPAKRSLFEVNSGVADAELARIIGTETEFPNLVRVHEPVLALSVSALVNTASKLWLSSWEEIAKHRVGYPRGYRLLEIRTRGMDAIQATDPAAVYRLVEGGRVDVGLMITSDAEMRVSQTEGITILEPPIETVTLYHYLNVKHRRLVPALEKILIEMNDSGRIREILRRSK